MAAVVNGLALCRLLPTVIVSRDPCIDTAQSTHLLCMTSLHYFIQPLFCIASLIGFFVVARGFERSPNEANGLIEHHAHRHIVEHVAHAPFIAEGKHKFASFYEI